MADSLYKKQTYEEDSRLKEAPKPMHFNRRYYSIIRLGKKYYNSNSIGGFERHMQRDMVVPNADTRIENEILIGGADVQDYVKYYMSDCKLRKNNVIAREMLLTATNGFFNMPKAEIDKWVDLQVSWVKKEFGDNCVYMVRHNDEHTPHCHLLIVPKFQNAKGENVLSNKRYFDGREALANWQTKYAEDMQSTFKQLNRGIKFSKAKHIEIRHFYSMLEQPIKENELKSVLANTVNSELLEIKLKSLEKTLTIYKDYWKKSDLEKSEFRNSNQELQKELLELKKDKVLYHTAIQTMSQLYKLPQNAIEHTLAYAEKELTIQPVKSIELERER